MDANKLGRRMNRRTALTLVGTGAGALLVACAAPAPAATPVPAAPAAAAPTSAAALAAPTAAPAAPAAQTTAAPKPAAQTTAAPKPAAQTSDLPRQMNVTTLPKFSEAPTLADRAKAGQLPPVEQRLPLNPPVVVPLEKMGKYGGQVRAHLLDIPQWNLAVRAHAHADLVRQHGGNSGKFEPDLAERWETSSDSRVWTFYLRKGLKWSDGKPFTTADLMFWYENVLLNDDLMPGKPAWLKSGNEVVKMEAVDETTLRLSFGAPQPLFLLGLTQGNSTVWTNWVNHPKHHMTQFHQKLTPQADIDAKVKAVGVGSWIDLYRRETEPHTASAGRPYLWPFVPDAPMEADGRWKFTRNPYYYKIDEAGNQLPYIDTWDNVKVTDNQAILLKTVAGEFDLMEIWIRGDMIPAIKDGIQRGAPLRILENLNAKAGEVSIYMNYTVDDPELRKIFDDVRFRQAVSLGIDRVEIAEARFRGFATPGQAAFPPIDPFVYDEEWFKAFTDYNPDQANKLLDEMGLTQKDSSGFRLRPDGQRLSIILDYQSGNHTQAIELVPEHMAKLGIEVRPRAQALALFLERTKSNSIHWAGWSFQPSFYSPGALLPGLTHRPFGVLWAEWYNTAGKQGEEPIADMKRVMELHDSALQAKSIEERATLIQDAGNLHKKNLWVIGIAGMDLRPHIVHNDLRNIPTTHYGLNVDPSSHSQYTESWFWDR